MKPPAAAAQICTVEVADRQFALHFVDGNFSGVLLKGRHAFRKAAGGHTFRLVDREKKVYRCIYCDAEHKVK